MGRENGKHTMLTSRYSANGVKRAIQQSCGNHSIGPCNPVQRSSHSEDPVMDARYDLAHTSFNASLISEICNVLSSLSDDDASFLGRDNSTECQRRLGIFLICAGSLMFVAIMIVIHIEVLERIIKEGIIASCGGGLA